MNLDLKHVNDMDQYISRAAIKAELERRMNEQQEICKSDVALGKDPNSKNIEVIYQFQQFAKFLDTLETKEIDFEKEFDNYANGILACDVQFEPFTHLHRCAKYFFELGLRTRE